MRPSPRLSVAVSPASPAWFFSGDTVVGSVVVEAGEPVPSRSLFLTLVGSVTTSTVCSSYQITRVLIHHPDIT